MTPQGGRAGRDAPQQLEELAQRGRAKQEQAAHEQEQKLRREQQGEARRLAARNRRADALLTLPVWRGLSRWSVVLILGLVGLAGSGFVIPILLGIDRDGTLALEWTAGIAVLLLLGLSGILVARRRDISFRSQLPFRVTRYEWALDAGRSYPRVRFQLRFAGTPPDARKLGDALALLAEPTQVETVEGSVAHLVVNSRTGSKLDGHRRWLPRWFRALCTQCLLPIHTSHPIDEVRFPD